MALSRLAAASRSPLRSPDGALLRPPRYTQLAFAVFLLLGSLQSTLSSPIPVVLPATLAYSSGGRRRGSFSENDIPQSCDAIYLCASGVCPTGMTKVAPPERSPAYTLRTGDGDWRYDPRSYRPGEMMSLYVKVVQKLIASKTNAGKDIGVHENSKYIGLLLYAVKTGDPTETRVGSWEVLGGGSPGGPVPHKPAGAKSRMCE